jgi:TRAP-type mannitol/chloroaromatic compound transport system permease small subunit
MTAAKRAAKALNRGLDALTRAGAWLALPLVVLLFVQLPLRELVGAGSRQANDIGQWVFAIYVALAVRHTTRQHGHLAADALAARYPPRVRRAIERFGSAICLLPWALFILVTAAPSTWRSVRTLESFPETSNPLYFIVKGSAWLLALLLALQSLADLLGGDAAPPNV